MICLFRVHCLLPVVLQVLMLNQGSLKNKGVEISLNGDILRNLNGWSWSLGGNIGFNKSKIGDLGFAPTDFGTLKNVRGLSGNFYRRSFWYC
jgi:hypothetical protein